MDNIWKVNGSTVELEAPEREALLYLHNDADIAKTTTIEDACENIRYSRHAHRVLNTLEDHGLVNSRIDKSQDDDSARKPPRVWMLTTHGQRFVDEHESDLGTADMDSDDLRTEVYELRQQLDELESEIKERHRELDDRLDDVSRDGVSAIRADLDQLENRVADVEAALGSVPSNEDLTNAKQEIRSEVTTTRSDLNERIRETNARVGDLEPVVESLEETVEELETWKAKAEQRWQSEVKPWIDWLYDNADALQAVVTSR